MDDIINKKEVYNPEGKLEGITHSVKLPERFAGIDRYDYAYDYDYYVAEDDNYYGPKVVDNNDTTTTKHNTYNKNHF